MQKISGTGIWVAVLSLLAITPTLSICVVQAADDVTEDQILQALSQKKPLTRGLSLTEREEIATIVKDKPKIDLEINFDYNSAQINAKSSAVNRRIQVVNMENKSTESK